MENGELEKELSRIKEDVEDLEMYIQEFTSFLPLAVCTVNPIGIIINVNNAFEQLTNYLAFEIIGQRIEVLFNEKDELEKVLETFKEQTEEFSRSQEVTLVTKTEAEVSVTITISRRNDREGEFLGYFFGISDITELKQFQENLEEQVQERTQSLNQRTEELETSRKELLSVLGRVESERNRTSAIVSNFTDGLIFIGQNGNLDLMNPQAERIFKLSFQHIRNKTLQELKEFERFKKLTKLLEYHEYSFGRVELPLDEDLILEASAVPMVGLQQENLGTLIILHDITREKTIETLKLEFVSVAAHQMRTPLAAIKWSFELIRNAPDSDVGPQQKALAQKGFDSSERILELINSLLTVDKIESGNFSYAFTEVQLTDIGRSLVKEIGEAWHDSNKSLVFNEPETTLPRVHADPVKIRAVLQNLIENALKYTMEGGAVTLGMKEREKDLIVFVQDSGIGIPESEQKKIFTKFFRAQNAVKVETDGTGLGLFIAKEIIEHHGGQIWFESQVGQGSIFYFTIPKQ